MIKKSRYMLQGTMMLGSFLTKYGLDTNVLVDLVLYPHAEKYFKKMGYSFPDKFLCILPQVIGETKGVLINKYDYDVDDANREIDRILKEFSINKLRNVPIEDDIGVIENIGSKYELNEEDVPIIYQFWKQKVKIVIVRDGAFEKTCKDLNIEVIKWPKKF